MYQQNDKKSWVNGSIKPQQYYKLLTPSPPKKNDSQQNETKKC